MKNVKKIGFNRMAKDLSTLAGRLASTRSEKGYSMEELARKAGTTRGVIQAAELGNVALPRPIVAIAKALEVTPAWLAFGEETVGGLSDDAIEVARSWDKLEEEVKSAVTVLAFSERTIDGVSDEAVEVAHSWDKLPEEVKKRLYSVIVGSP